jgi:anti-sigma B factor antagonist
MDFSLKKTASGHIVLGIKGDLDLYSQNELKELYQRKLRSLSRDLIFDMDMVEYLDSSGVGCLINLYQMQKASGFSLYFIRMQSQVFKVIKLTRLDQVLKIYKTIDEIPFNVALGERTG